MPNTISNKNDLFSLFEEVFQDWAEEGKVLTEMSDKARKKEAQRKRPTNSLEAGIYDNRVESHALKHPNAETNRDKREESRSASTKP